MIKILLKSESLILDFRLILLLCITLVHNVVLNLDIDFWT